MHVTVGRTGIEYPVNCTRILQQRLQSVQRIIQLIRHARPLPMLPGFPVTMASTLTHRHFPNLSQPAGVDGLGYPKRR